LPEYMVKSMVLDMPPATRDKCVKSVSDVCYNCWKLTISLAVVHV
jgi:hypothetical protein